MRLSWNEVRARAAAFADEWGDAHYEKGETQSFYNEFFEVFGLRRRRVASFEEPVRLLGNRRGFIDLFWKGVLLVEQKSAGRDLRPARTQALDYFPGLSEAELPRYLLLSDFQTFELHDLESDGVPIAFSLSELPRYVEAFGFILGVQRRSFKEHDPANIEAAELMGQLHDALEATGYRGRALERLLVRLLFCLFADHTGIFELGDFQALIQERTSVDGSDLGAWLSHLFEVLNTDRPERQNNLDEDLSRFDYINGELFAERLPPAAFDREMRELLLRACGFRWAEISPAIFGSLFQFVMNPEERAEQGAHYTSERDILKVIEPLSLDSLRSELSEMTQLRRGREAALHQFQDKLAGLRFLDPACGCGNFLVIAYRELRELEINLLKELFPDRRQRHLDVAVLSRLNVDQFFGIEINEFASLIAEVALWLTDHIMNNQLSLEFGEVYVRIPLRATPHIHCGDALEVDWNDVLPASECSYVCGNPPFRGSKRQSQQQRAQVRRLTESGARGGSLDFVAAWFVKAAAYIAGGTATIGFVATNSITQGEQVAQLWPLLFGRYGIEIAFAHRTFAWESEARGAAHVHVVILGLVRREQEPQSKKLFSYSDIFGDPVETKHASLTAYLFDASQLANRHLVVGETTRPLTDVPEVAFGNMPNDDGNLILTTTEAEEFSTAYPNLRTLLRPLIGSREFLNGEQRFCLWLVGADPAQIRHNAVIQERVARVRAYRLKSTRARTQALANTPTLFGEIRHTGEPFILIPRHSSERREYVPMGFYTDDSIVHDSCLFAPNATLFDFGVLTSAMHMAWLRNIGGRIKSDYRYSVNMVLNPFPWPSPSEAQRQQIEGLAQGVLNARALFPAATLADMYDPNSMHTELRAAHRALDAAVDRLYRRAAFTSDRERIEQLFSLYERLVVPIEAAARPVRRPRGRA